MPNWCENDLTIEGPRERVEDFLEFAAGEGPLDFNRFLPYPERFRRLDENADAWEREHQCRADVDWRRRPKDGFNSGDHEWRVESRGTRWHAFRVDREGPEAEPDGKAARVVFHFATAWSPPVPAIARAAELFPTLALDLRYYEYLGQFHGVYRCAGGACVEDAFWQYPGSRGG